MKTKKDEYIFFKKTKEYLIFREKYPSDDVNFNKGLWKAMIKKIKEDLKGEKGNE